MWITVACLFLGRAVTPLASESLDAATTALIEDRTLNVTASDLAQLSSAGAVCGAFGKLIAGPAIGVMNGRNAWLALLFVGSIAMLCIANVSSMTELFIVWLAYTPFAAMAFPATTVIVAGWVDGDLLGRVLGILTFAAKGAPSLVDVTAMSILREEANQESPDMREAEKPPEPEEAMMCAPHMHLHLHLHMHVPSRPRCPRAARGPVATPSWQHAGVTDPAPLFLLAGGWRST